MLLINALRAFTVFAVFGLYNAYLKTPITWDQGLGIFSLVFVALMLYEIVEEKLIDSFNSKDA